MRTGSGRALGALIRLTALGLGGALLLLSVAAVFARTAAPLPVATIAFPFAGDMRGGWSGIDVSPDGSRFWAVSDRGDRTDGALRRDDEGRLVGIDAADIRRLPGLEGGDIREADDAEGIDVRPSDNEAFVSFEGFVRLRRYPGSWAKAEWVPDLDAARAFHINRGFEAVARDRDGHVYTLPERVRRPGAPYPLFRYSQPIDTPHGAWSVAAELTSDEGWNAVGADFGPDGAFYLLERRFGVVGFGSRIRRFDLAAALPGTSLGGSVVFESPLGRHGNLEGLGIWIDGEERLRAVMIADDNRLAFQRSEVVEAILGRVPLAPGALAQ